MQYRANQLSAFNKVVDYFRENYKLLGLWMLFRVITSVTIAVASDIKPITDIEQKIQLWPPSLPLINWFERVFISPWYRWDVEWYTRIILEGYASNDGTTNFHPLFPWLGKILSSFGFDPILSLLIISTISTYLLLHILQRLSKLNNLQENNNLLELIFLVFPISFILYAPYPESLFLFFSAVCLYSLRKKNWKIAGISSLFAVLTRQQGLLLLFPYIMELWNTSDRKVDNIKQEWQSWLSIMHIPSGYLFWFVYRLIVIGDSSVKTNNIQEIIYSFFISPSATKVVPNQEFRFPWNTLSQGYNKITTSPDIDIWFNVILAIFFIWAFAISWKYLTSSYRVYSASIFVVSFSYYTGTIHPLMGLPRHLLLAFPILIGLAPAIGKRKYITWSFITISTIMMLLLITGYALNAWVP